MPGKGMIIRLAEAQNWRCCHCGGRMDGIFPAPDAPTIEHVIPRIEGGRNGWENYAAAHKRCNELRGRRRYDWIRRLLAKQERLQRHLQYMDDDHRGEEGCG